MPSAVDLPIPIGDPLAALLFPVAVIIIAGLVLFGLALLTTIRATHRQR